MSDRFRIRWAEPALLDLLSLLEFVGARDSAAAASRLGERLLAAAESLAALPTRGRVVPERQELGIAEFRELIARPHRLCYRVHGREVAIVAVLDVRRDLEELLVERALRITSESE